MFVVESIQARISEQIKHELSEFLMLFKSISNWEGEQPDIANFFLNYVWSCQVYSFGL